VNRFRSFHYLECWPPHLGQNRGGEERVARGEDAPGDGLGERTLGRVARLGLAPEIRNNKKRGCVRDGLAVAARAGAALTT